MAKHARPETRPEGLNAPKARSTGFFALVLACFFVSGLTGLTYEILWTRMIVKIIGSSPFAVSIVLTVFMGGLGLGSYIAGRSIDRIAEPRRLVRLYGLLELCIGGYGIVLPFLLGAFKPLYAAAYNSLFEHFLAYNLLTFAGCVVLLILPVTLMGATLPILARFFVTSLSRVGTHVGRLYGLNTIGAAAGSLLCGFWLIDLLGVWGTLSAAVGLNGLIGAACLFMGARIPARAPIRDGAAREPAEAEGGAAPDSAFAGWALVIFAVSGFCAMAYEVIWIRLLGLIVGPTTYSFTIVLVTFITGLALGAMFFGWLGDRLRRPIVLLISTQIAAGLCALLFSQIAGTSQIFFAKLIYHFKDEFSLLYGLKAFVLFVLMFPPTFFLGATFPLVGKIYTKSLSRTGRSIGFAYAVNSAGAVLGSFCAGFVLIPYAGKEDGLRLVIALQLLAALAVSLRVFRSRRTPLVRWAPLALAVAVGLGFAARFPHWDRGMLSKARYHRFDRPEIRSVGWLSALFASQERFSDRESEKVLYYGDGIGGFTTVLETEILGERSYSLCNSGKADASYPGDMPTQALFAHFPLLFHPQPDDVLIIGLASGITAGEVLNYPVRRLDVVDINEQVVAASAFFEQWNGGVLADPRTRLIIQDGCAHLALTNRKYDVISSEPSNPWMAGLASLFTREFFELARDHLEDGGMFVQFTHAYQMDWPTFAMIGRTFTEVFPNSFIVNTQPTTRGPDYLLIGIKGGRKLDAAVAERNLEHARRSRNMTLPDHRFLYNLIVGENLRKLFGDGPVHTENRPRLEFAAPRLIHSNDPSVRAEISDRRWLSATTMEIVRATWMDFDKRIDFAAFALSLNSPEIVLENRLGLDRATDAQRRRLSDLFADYCGRHVVGNLFHLRDPELRERSLAAQEALLRARMAGASRPAPFAFRLGEMCAQQKRLDEAARFYEEALRHDPKYAEAHNALGNLLASRGRHEEALEHHMTAIKLSRGSAVAYNNMGCTLSEQGRTEEALEYYAKALRADPEFAVAHYNMGKDLAAQGRLEAAMEHFSAAVRSNPGYSEAYNGLGGALLAQGRLDEAIAQYGAALRIGADDAAAHEGMARALTAQRRTGEAIEHLSAAAKLAPDNAKTLNALARTLATAADPRYRDGARAVELSLRACELTENRHPQLLDTLAAAYAETGDFAKAVDTARKAIAIARSAGRADMAREIETRLELYTRGAPYRAGS
jgi:spermidine synthase